MVTLGTNYTGRLLNSLWKEASEMYIALAEAVKIEDL